MNKKNLDTILYQYERDFELLNKPEADGGHDEGYKWRAESTFVKEWDIDAEDFAGMFAKAMGSIAKTNLINNSAIQPISGLTEIMKHDGGAEFVRGEFRKLFSDDDGDLDARGERVNSFMDAIDQRIEELFPGSWRFKQPRNAVIYYLNLWKPEENFLYKATQANSWAAYLDFPQDIGSGKSFSLRKYYAMCEELLDELDNYSGILKLNEERVSQMADGFDDQRHMLVFDIIYCSYYMGYYRECPAIEKKSSKAKAQAAKMAELNERIERLEKERLEKAEELAAIESKLRKLPDLTGAGVKHKTFGKGTITSNDNGLIFVEFDSSSKKFGPESFKGGFISFDDNDLQQMVCEMADTQKKKQELERLLSRLTMELSIIQ